MTNVLTVDVEDWFQVENYAGAIPRDSWPQCQLRVSGNVDFLLRLFCKHKTTATFFVLGWMAKRVPTLVKTIADAGHEIASHGWSHTPIWRLTPEQFRTEVSQSRLLLQELSGQEIRGYRAPTFSITRGTLWALRILSESGYVYDSSIFPVHHDMYGIPDAPLGIHYRQEELWELPLSIYRIGSMNLPVAGGGYFRLYPQWVTHKAIRQINASGRPAVVYVHPWEFDPDQPQVQGVSFSKALRHRVGLARNRQKLDRLIQSFPFAPAWQVLQSFVAKRNTTAQGDT